VAARSRQVGNRSSPLANPIEISTVARSFSTLARARAQKPLIRKAMALCPSTGTPGRRTSVCPASPGKCASGAGLRRSLVQPCRFSTAPRATGVPAPSRPPRIPLDTEHSRTRAHRVCHPASGCFFARVYRLELFAWTNCGLAIPGRRMRCRVVGDFASRNGRSCTALPVSADS